MTAADALVIVAEAAGLVTVFLVVLRWPGRTLGPGVSLVLWTVVGPWASWVGLVVTVAGVLGWLRWGPHRGRRRGLWRWPLLGVGVAGSLAVLVGPVSWVRVAGFGTLAVLAGWLARRPADRHDDGPGVVPAVPAVPAVPERSGRLVAAGAAERVVQHTLCERCGSLVEIEVPVVGDPVFCAARATCGGCGVQYVGVVDTTPGAGGRVLWFAQPDPDPSGTDSEDRRSVS